MVKLLSQHDVNEVVMFQQHLADMQTMNRADFARKYKDYMGLNDAELKAYIEHPEPAKGGGQ